MSNIAGNASVISAMDFRKEPGSVLDRVDYRNETFVVKRAGKAKAVLIPMREYEQLQRIKQDAKDRFWLMTQELQAAFRDVDPGEVEREIEQAVKEVRTRKNHDS